MYRTIQSAEYKTEALQQALEKALRIVKKQTKMKQKIKTFRENRILLV